MPNLSTARGDDNSLGERVDAASVCLTGARHAVNWKQKTNDRAIRKARQARVA